MIRRRVALVLSGMAAIIAAILYQPPAELLAGSSAASAKLAVPIVEAGPDSRGVSGDVQMQFVRAGERVAFPVRVRGDARGFTYQWIEIRSNSSADVARPLRGDTLLAPLTPGFYELAVTRAGGSPRKRTRSTRAPSETATIASARG